MREGYESSYGWSNTDEDGWDPRYYFTYYTTLGHRSGSKMCAETILFVVILVMSLLANVAIITAILSRKEIRTVTNCFIVNLACADLVFVMIIPAIAGARGAPSWNLGAFTCKLLPYSQFVCGSVLLWTLTAISFDRVRCLAAAPYRSGLTHRTAAFLCIGAWFAALLVYLPVPIFFREQKVEYNTTYHEENPDLATLHTVNATICTLVFPASKNINASLAFTISIVIITCIIPMMILVFNCHIIFKSLRKIQLRLKEKVGGVENTSANKIKQSILTITGNILPASASQRLSDSAVHAPVTRLSSSGGFQRLQKHRRAVRILISNVLAVLLMWLPITVVMFLIYVDGHRSDDQFFLTNQYFIWAVIIGLMNTIVNPILYGFLTENFRDYYPWRRWLKKCCCLKWTQSSDVKSNHNISSSRNASTFNLGDDTIITVR